MIFQSLYCKIFFTFFSINWNKNRYLRMPCHQFVLVPLFSLLFPLVTVNNISALRIYNFFSSIIIYSLPTFLGLRLKLWEDKSIIVCWLKEHSIQKHNNRLDLLAREAVTIGEILNYSFTSKEIISLKQLSNSALW